MKHLRVAILTHEDLVPPVSLDGLDAKQIQEIKAEYDVAHALEVLGHEQHTIGVSDDLLPIRTALEAWQPHAIFNLLMEFRDVGHYQAYVTGYLELLGAAYTGCNPRGILLSRDKVLSKKILRYHRIPTPPFAVFRPGGAVRAPRGLRFPVIVKSSDEEASIGIAQASVVRNLEQLAERVAFIHEHVGSDALAEEYIDGREITISVLGNRRLETFPIWEMTFARLPDGSVPIATERAKWDPEYQKRVGISIGEAKGLPDGAADRIRGLARRTYRALGLSGYARLDLRLTDEGRVYVLEANATPDLSADEDFALSARAAGLPYPELIQRILNLALRAAHAPKRPRSPA